jgi:hypothetical protein
MEGNRLEMELTDTMAKELTSLFNIEIEIMRGTKEMMPDGRTRYTLSIECEQKSKLIVEFIMGVMFRHLGDSRN